MNKNIKICLDAGHGINTSGKRTPLFADGSHIKECEQNYAVMFLVEKYLLSIGFDVIVSNRDIKKDMKLKDRCFVANNNNCDMFLSIHKNAFTGKWQKSACGIESFVYAFGGVAEVIGSKIHSRLIKSTMMKNRGLKQANFYVLRCTYMPAVLVELGFMDYYSEALQMRDKKWHNIYSKAICKGICDYYKINCFFD